MSDSSFAQQRGQLPGIAWGGLQAAGINCDLPVCSPSTSCPCFTPLLASACSHAVSSSCKEKSRLHLEPLSGVFMLGMRGCVLISVMETVGFKHPHGQCDALSASVRQRMNACRWQERGGTFRTSHKSRSCILKAQRNLGTSLALNSR